MYILEETVYIREAEITVLHYEVSRDEYDILKQYEDQYYINKYIDKEALVNENYRHYDSDIPNDLDEYPQCYYKYTLHFLDTPEALELVNRTKSMIDDPYHEFKLNTWKNVLGILKEKNVGEWNKCSHIKTAYGSKLNIDIKVPYNDDYSTYEDVLKKEYNLDSCKFREDGGYSNNYTLYALTEGSRGIIIENVIINTVIE